MPAIRTRVCSALILIALASPIGAADAEKPGWNFQNVDRVVAFADVHGDFEHLVDLLQGTNVIDDSLDWVGGATHLVSTGDLLDRGPRSRDVLDLLIKLQQQAPRDGGQVIVTLGNHEVMNLQGDLRYVSDEEYAAFRDASVDASFASQPPGFIGHRRAFSAVGEYGRWLLQQPLMVKVNDRLFVHGGFPPYLYAFDLDWVNTAYKADLVRFVEIQTALVNANLLDPTQSDDDQIRWARVLLQGEGGFSLDVRAMASLREFVKLFDATVLHRDSITWYRNTGICHPVSEDVIFTAILEKYGADAAMIGHNTTRGVARSRLGGRVVMMDTGMLKSHYNGRPSALVIEGGVETVFYGDTNETGVPLPIGIGERLNPYGLSDTELDNFLRSARIVEIDEADSRRVTLGTDGLQFTMMRLDENEGAKELAVFRMDRLLGLGLVPFTARIELAGTAAVYQLRIAYSISESQRYAMDMEVGGWCRIEDEHELMYLFDAVIGNYSRNASNLLYTRGDWTLYLVNNSTAFNSEKKLPQQLDSASLAIPPLLAEKLKSMDRKSLRALLGESLDSSQIRAILKRRDQLLKRLPLKTIHHYVQRN